jgi:hypothetical protein
MVPRNYRGDSFSATCLPMQCPGDPNGEVINSPVPPPPPPPSSGGGNGGGSSSNFARRLDCESCTNAGGEWCDAGWNTRAWVRSGVCVDPAVGCPRWQTTVTAASQCYVECSYGRATGTCRGSQNCQAGGGSLYSSRSGASGCQREPGSVMCCIGGEFGRKRSVEEVAAEPVVEVEAPKNDKRQAEGVKVKVGTTWHSCPVEGGEVEFGTRGRSDYSGAFRCPSLNEMCCSERNFCNWRGKCVRGFCNCNQGFTGDQCERNAELPTTTAPSRASWTFPPQFVVELPNIDLPRPSDEELGLTPEEIPDGVGKVERVDEDNSSGENGGAGIDQTTLIVIVVLVVVFVLLAVGIGATLYFVYNRKKKVESH